VRVFKNLLNECELASLLGLTVMSFSELTETLKKLGLPEPLVSIGVGTAKPLWSQRRVDAWLAAHGEHVFSVLQDDGNLEDC